MKYFGLLILILITLRSFSQDFYFGNDLSYVNEMEDAGAVYKENMQPKDVYHIFADHGTNLVRVRLWVDPSWWQSPLQQPAGVKAYYNDIVDVKETISRSKAAGMKVMLDLPYSDFWSDPAKQLIPRRWVSVANNLTALKDSVYNYTFQLLTMLDKEGLMPDIVKVGNETTGGFMHQIPADNNSFEVKSTVSTSWSRHAQLFNSAIKAIRDVGKTASINPKIALHFTNGLSKQVGYYRNVINNGVTDFDIMGFSYYYSWHGGSIQELQNTVKSLKTNFPQYDAMVVETGYLWTTQNFDQMGNIINDPDPAYLPVIPEKQLEYMVDYTRAVMKGGGIGVIFWEPAWVSTKCRTPWGVGSSHDHVVFFDPVNTNFMDNGGGRWMESQFYTDIDNYKVTFKVNMTGKDVSNGVYITGDFSSVDGNWQLLPMASEGNSIYSYFTYLKEGTTGAYYFLNGNDWNAREKVPSTCATANTTDRQYTIPGVDIVYTYSFGQCTESNNQPIKITFKVDMTEQDQSRGVYITGDINAWALTKMTSEGNNIYSWSTTLAPGAEMAYYYLTTSTWTNYLNYRETVPTECALLWNSDRKISVPVHDSIIGNIWGSCSTFPVSASTLAMTREIQITSDPTGNIVSIESNAPLDKMVLNIFNLSGQIDRSIRFTGNNSKASIDVSDIPRGIYLFSLQSANWIKTYRIFLH